MEHRFRCSRDYAGASAANETADGCITGDVSAGAAEAVKAVSPAPGGVGTLTTAILFRNVLKAQELRSFRPQPDRGALTKRWCRRFRSQAGV
ncbi:hypothetical protein [Paenibacillus oleatilyticus]|uniref:Tetrahydrofolate dehydrogenase/cyclohydrolase NAD(P)-binding domain-containing protein n=1 Tax=Paenibacillus oleatilyticus TaxID=2594886 RepID=A0ABV4V763_9BACL